MFRAMLPLEPLALHHSWPLVERDQRFVEAVVHDAPPGIFVSRDAAEPRAALVGRWRCRLSDSSLDWSDAVYALFGLPVAPIDRSTALSLYVDTSRMPVERLRAYAIRHRRGFTVDAEITTVQGRARWMRLMAAPLIEHHVVTTLHGYKQDVTHLYR